MSGILFCQSYFQKENEIENEIRQYADLLTEELNGIGFLLDHHELQWVGILKRISSFRLGWI